MTNSHDRQPDLQALHLAYVRVLGNEGAREVLADIERRGLVRETTFAPDPCRAAFNEGRRSLALHILRMLEGIPANRQPEVRPEGEAAPGP